MSTCPLCSSSKLKSKPFGYRYKNRWLGGRECKDCGIIFIDPQPSAQEITEMYSKEYFEGDFRCGHAGSYFSDDSLNRLVDTSLLERIRHYRQSGKFLEVGCAGGAFLSAAKKLGYDVHVVDLEVVTGDIHAANFPAETFDVIFMGDVLEHLPDPIATLKEINRITALGGLLVILVPTQTNTLFSRLGFVIYRALGKNAIVHLPPYHLFEYRSASLEILLCRCGFRSFRKSESLLPPNEITLRGTLMQRIGKKLFQYPNYLVTALFGAFGDRVELYATKQTHLPL
ncbi:MAG: class I SAM-dependent methyltransferase [Ignavibacteriales bacterium]|nr:class I SAM-dependent methyltransferase [Ignavibacteriales bacterium]